MSGERQLEYYIEEVLKHKGFDLEKLQRQDATEPEIKKLLNSKKNNVPGLGRPEFVYRLNGLANDILVVEVKAEAIKHSSPNEDDPVNFAVDGVKHYMKGLSKKFNIVGVAISGSYLKVSTFTIAKGGETIVDENQSDLLTPLSYINMLRKTKQNRKVQLKEVYKYAESLNTDLHNNSISNNKRASFVSAVLLALSDSVFESNYNNYSDAGELAEYLLDRVESSLKRSNIPHRKVEVLMSIFNFIKIDTKINTGSFLKNSIDGLADNLLAIKNTSLDYLGLFYEEFIKYGGGDQDNGVVLTPKHIAELMVKLCGTNKNSTVLDICTGSATFLIYAMDMMIEDANHDQHKIEEIKANQLIGIELQPEMFALACSSMILRQDGKSNLFNDDCFNPAFSDPNHPINLNDNGIYNQYIKGKANVAIMNPPYGKAIKIEEIEFIERGLDLLAEGGMLAAIVPISTAIDTSKKALVVRERILKNNTLVASLNVSPKLFSKKGGADVATCILVFKAGVPHSKSRAKTYLADWTYDGFGIFKNVRREIEPGTWDSVRDEYLDQFANKEAIDKKAMSINLTALDEWLLEAHLPSINNINSENMAELNFNYSLFNSSKLEDIDNLYKLSKIIKNLEKTPIKDTANLNTVEWESFKLGDLFSIQKGRNITITSANKNPGETPFISCTTRFNGIASYTGLPAKHKAGSITVTVNGQPGIAFYQPVDFIGNSDVLVLPNNLSKAACMFICTAIKNESWRFSYARKLNMERANELSILLPATKKKEPDYQLMEDIILSMPYSKVLSE